MPARVMTRRVESDAVQGEGSFVLLRRLTVGELKEYQEELGAEGADVLDLGARWVPKLVAAWNWVDDEGKPLPQPSEDPKIGEKLTEDEFSFIFQAVKQVRDEAQSRGK